MAILGLGSHLIECLRVARLLERHADVFLDLVFTPHEQAYCRDRLQRVSHLSALWAGKEAVHRALGLPWRRGFSWHDVELADGTQVLTTPRLAGRLAGHARDSGVRHVLVTLAHTRGYATATAIAE